MILVGQDVWLCRAPSFQAMGLALWVFEHISQCSKRSNPAWIHRYVAPVVADEVFHFVGTAARTPVWYLRSYIAYPQQGYSASDGAKPDFK